jgi:hypothetical protein
MIFPARRRKQKETGRLGRERGANGWIVALALATLICVAWALLSRLAFSPMATHQP